MISTRHIPTGRLLLAPVSPADLRALVAFKADPLIYAQMLGGVRTPVQIAEELVGELQDWAIRGVGMWTVRRPDEATLLGLTGVHDRADGRGTALRFAFHPAVRGQGLGREAARAALQYVHDRAGVKRVVSVTRETNVASRTLLGGIGMRPCDTFLRDGTPMLTYESVVG